MRFNEKRTSKKNKLPVELLEKGETTREELERMWEVWNGGTLRVIWDYKWNKEHMRESMRGVPYIINIGNPLQMGGTHWIAVIGDYYMDSFGLPPTHILMDSPPPGGWKWNKNQIQSIVSGGCGQYALYFLYKVKQDPENGINEFFKTFNIYI